MAPVRGTASRVRGAGLLGRVPATPWAAVAGRSIIYWLRSDHGEPTRSVQQEAVGHVGGDRPQCSPGGPRHPRGDPLEVEPATCQQTGC
jgi:hypothetical protein